MQNRTEEGKEKKEIDEGRLNRKRKRVWSRIQVRMEELQVIIIKCRVIIIRGGR